MALRKAWRDLNQSTVGAAPERYGYYELGDGSGERIGRGVGVLRDELKEVMAYGDAAKVRWTAATSQEHAERLFDDNE